MVNVQSTPNTASKTRSIRTPFFSWLGGAKEGRGRRGSGWGHGGTARKQGLTRCMTKSHVTGPFGTAVVVGGEKVTVVLQGWLYSSPGTGGD